MKRISSIVLASAVVLAFTSSSFAYPAVDHFTKGAKEVITSPLTVKDSVMTETKGVSHRVLPFALTGSLLKGTFYMGKHIVDGAYAMATSPLEIIKK